MAPQTSLPLARTAKPLDASYTPMNAAIYIMAACCRRHHTQHVANQHLSASFIISRYLSQKVSRRLFATCGHYICISLREPMGQAS